MVREDNAHTTSAHLIDPVSLSVMMGQEYPPTPQQAAVIGAPLEPMLVVAGAGAGKTATMAARVVWLVANGLVKPEEVLGLTFTRKAARELGARIRGQLALLASSSAFRRQASPEVLKSLEIIAPTTLTYDSYATSIVRSYGLLLPTEPEAKIVDGATQWQMAWETALEIKKFNHDLQPESVAKRILALGNDFDSNLATLDDVITETEAFIKNIEQTPQKQKNKQGLLKDLEKVVDIQQQRLDLLDHLGALRQRFDDENCATFAMQMARAATLAYQVDEVGAKERAKFKIIMLDEYQDTSHTQRLFLRALFSGATVTAVGDPMQAIYGWRGATAENLIQFVNDFPQSNGEPAEKKQLTVSWRNPSAVLDVANVISDSAFQGKPRTVEPLTPGVKSAGEVTISLLATGEEEVNYIADEMEREYSSRTANNQKFDAAILVRSNAESAAFLTALTKRGVPAAIIGVGGLLSVPEVLDVISVMRVLHDPSNDAAMMRILLSPQVNLGVADIKILEKRARHLAQYGQAQGPAGGATSSDGNETASGDLNTEGNDAAGLRPDATPIEKLEFELDQLIAAAEEDSVAAGLGYAVADPDIYYKDGTPPARGSEAANGPLTSGLAYSAESMRRIVDLGAKLRHLRRYSLGKPLPELISDIETAFGIRVEAAAGQFGASTSITSATTAQLDRFIDIAAEFSVNQSDNVASFLAYLEYASDQDNGLTQAPVYVPDNCVHIMTMHKSKGLEWDIVAVPRVTAKTFDRPDANSWINKPTALPPGAIVQVDLIGQESGDDSELAKASIDEAVPVLDTSDAENQTELNKTIKEYQNELKALEREESQRVFYVAATRSAEKLIITSSIRPVPGLKKTSEPSSDFLLLAERFPTFIGAWCEEDPGMEEPSVNLDPETALDGVVWPIDVLDKRRTEVENGAALVRQMRSNLSTGQDSDNQAEHHDAIPGDLSEIWEVETTLLLNELRQRQTESIKLPMPVQLSTSEYQALMRDPVEFARRQARPVPFKPNRFARRGTAFHAWMENLFGTHSLIDDNDLFEDALDTLLDSQETATEAELSDLKDKFLASEWADRGPEYVEVPFEIGIGNRRIVGRIDAVFRIGDTWMVVDWKTGHKPSGEHARLAALQLAIYRIAWADRRRQAGEDIQPEDIRAAFHYVGSQKTVEPSEEQMPSRLELDRELQKYLDQRL